MSLPAAVYRPRNPQLSDYYRCMEDYDGGMFRVAPPLELKKAGGHLPTQGVQNTPEQGEDLAGDDTDALHMGKHSGFHVFCGNRISPNDDTVMENLGRYIIRASFSQERMQYLDQEGKVIYTSKDSRTSRGFPDLEDRQATREFFSLTLTEGSVAFHRCGFLHMSRSMP